MATNSSHFLSLSTASNVLQSQIQMQKFRSNQILTVCKLILNQYQFDMMIDNRWTLTLFLLQEKYNQLLAQIPELRWILKNPKKNPDKSILNKSFPRSMAQRGEDFLYFKHMQGNAPHATLLMEMLHAKKR